MSATYHSSPSSPRHRIATTAITVALCGALTCAPVLATAQPTATQAGAAQSAPYPAAAMPTSDNPPPRPLTPGKMPVVLGWITFGVGTLATVGGLQFMLLSTVDCDINSSPSGSGGSQEDCGPSSNSVLFTTTAGTVALLGLGVAIYGHARRSNARYDQREWDRRYGGQPLAWGVGDRMWASISPMVMQRRGLSVALHF